jgi:sugar lactone lactonase YvrE
MRITLRFLGRTGLPGPAVRGALAATVLTLALGACGGEKPKETAAATKVVRDENAPLHVLKAGLSTPESVLWDKTRRVWYISNINGNPTAKDDNGYIVRVGPDLEPLDSVPFINGADDDITLNAPKGLALQGDTLWVADIDAVRGFDVTTGMSVATIDLRPMRATFLNDIAVSNEGSLYITDSGIAFAADGSVTHPGLSRVFEIRNRVPRQALVLPKESAANGIAWWPGRNAWLIVGFNTPDIYQWFTGAKEATVIAKGPGGADGIVVLADGSAIYTSWADSTLQLLAGTLTTTLRRGLPAPADLGYDPLRNVIAVPLFNDNRVEIWPVTATPTVNAPPMLRP